MATDTKEREKLPRRTISLLLSWGLIVWLVIAIAIRFVGHILLNPADRILVTGFFIAVIPLMALVTYPVYSRL